MLVFIKKRRWRILHCRFKRLSPRLKTCYTYNMLAFHPLVNAWFIETFGKPTAVQEEAWPLITKGENVLALAPTGSGKTLTGFLAAISRFAEGVYNETQLSVLYVSPLKALNEDIKRNLLLPLEGIRAHFEKEGLAFPAVRVETRSGDTPQSERQRFLSRPPSILALTPESLGIILLNPRGRQVLSTVRYCILDEIHASLGTKRGSYLSCQIDRLSLIAGEFQRIALSATVNPPEVAADFAGGLRKITAAATGGTSSGISPVYEKRKVCIVAPDEKKEIQFQVIYPDEEDDGEDVGVETAGGKPDKPAGKSKGKPGAERYGRRYTELVSFILERIKAGSRTTAACLTGGKSEKTILVFTDSRRRAERISYLLNLTAANDVDFAGQPGLTGKTVAYAHHGSLSKEVRREVEKALVAGDVSCVVATGSLELGIDIGMVDEVILAGSPLSALVALQRVGRSGHTVGMRSQGTLIPFHGMDLIQAAAISGAVEERELEKTATIENPLDILAQIILALCTEKPWQEDELYETLLGFYVYRNLPKSGYEGVLRMLTGAYEGTRLRELKRQLFRDDETKILSPSPGALLLLYTSGGVITSRGYYSLRLAPGTEGAGTKIGELDEEFVWERRLGDCFDFGNRSWRISKIGDEAVEVIPLTAGIDSVPFWRGETIFRSQNISRRILSLLDGYYPKGWTSLKAERMLDNFTAQSKKALEDYLHSQWSFQQRYSPGIPLPGPSFIPVEIIDDIENRGDSYLVVFHSFRGGAVNYPLSLALCQECEASYRMRVEAAADDNAVFIRLPRSIGEDPTSFIKDSLRRLCVAGMGERRFRERLESSGLFGAAFREAAERSLILPRSPYGKRMPLWITRQKSRRLFDAVSSFRDFPVSAEAWRTCLKEQFDMEGFNSLLEEITSGALILDFFRTPKPSPFAKELFWAETNVLMYQYDERPDLLGPPSKGSAGPSLSDKVIAEAIGSASIRPPLKAELVGDFCSRLRREIPGWAPEDALTLCEWVKERVAIPSNGEDEEWERLLKCIPSGLAEALSNDSSLGGKLQYIKRNDDGISGGVSGFVVIHRDWVKKRTIDSWRGVHNLSLQGGIVDCLGQWLRYEGPVSKSRIAAVFGISLTAAEDAVNALTEAGEVVSDVAVLETKEEGLTIGETTSPQPASPPPPPSSFICDRGNLELLLRLGRSKQRPQIKERPASLLVPLLARRQGLYFGRTQNSPQSAENGSTGITPWKHLAGLVAPVKLWETEFFPCRSPSYSGEMFDREIREGRLIWYGAGKEKAAFCFTNDLDLVLPFAPAPFSQEGRPSRQVLGILPKLPGNFFDTPRCFWEIKDALAANGGQTGGASNHAALNDYAQALWEEVWRGSLSADSWEPVRKALESGFSLPSADSPDESSIDTGGGNSLKGSGVGASSRSGRLVYRVPRAIRERWRTGPPVRGNWFSLYADGAGDLSPLEEEELNRERVRLLLDRWGILARPLLEREGPLLSWSRLLPAMRRLELAGELVAGRFFSGITSLQFASPRIAGELEEAEAERGIYWMNAADPASPAGLAIQGVMRSEAAVGGLQIRRIPTTRLCFRGAELIAVSNRNGSDMEIYIPPDDPDLTLALAFFKTPRTRKVQPENKISIEKINGKSAGGGAYYSILTDLGFVKDRGRMVLW